jgi:tetratricopeptide (TPR) repeat protein
MTRERDDADAKSSAALGAQAEAERRAGRPERARELAQAALDHAAPHPSAHAAFVLALIDCGDLVSAHRALERAYLALGGELVEPGDAHAGESWEPSAAPLAALAEAELESAFEAAESQPDEMHDANQVAAAALELVEDGTPEGVDLTSTDSPFATETVASLLERQGRPERAGEVRSAARARGQLREVRLDEGRRARVVATLTRWLDNLRRRTA